MDSPLSTGTLESFLPGTWGSVTVSPSPSLVYTNQNMAHLNSLHIEPVLSQLPQLLIKLLVTFTSSFRPVAPFPLSLTYEIKLATFATECSRVPICFTNLFGRARE